jgi:predicted phosphodiesterase
VNIQLLSDLHLEAHPLFAPVPAPGADLLVLAGDIGSYQPGSKLLDADFGLARFSPRNGWPTPVLFVPGNHEYDTLDFDAAHARLRETCDRLGIIWLERETWVMNRNLGEAGTLRFIGTTLWTDFDALAEVKNTELADSPDGSRLARSLKQRDKAFRAANYYLKKAAVTRHDQPWLAPGVREQGLLCQQWLRAQLQTPFEGATVVITHFAPSLHSADPRYGMTPGTAGFCNALDDMLPHAQLWLHGHLHAPSHYEHRGCRVIANPMGYERKNEQMHFLPQMLIQV